MTPMPNPWLTDSAAASPAADTAVATYQPPDAATAVLIAEPPVKMEEVSPQAPAADALNPHETAGALETDCIGEIFHYARKLGGDGISLLELRLRGFDVDGFMLEIEPPPLFLQRAAE